MESGVFRENEVWAELRDLVEKRCFLKGRFVLSSGKVSSYYFDCRKITLNARGSLLIAEIILSIIGDVEKESGRQVDAVGGPTLGADPIAAAVSLRSAQQQRDPIEAFIVRKEPKTHGTNLEIENNPPHGAGIVVVEDVVTTGGSTFKAIESIEKAGLEVLGVISIIDRQQGGGEAISEKYRFIPLFVTSDFDTGE